MDSQRTPSPDLTHCCSPSPHHPSDSDGESRPLLSHGHQSYSSTASQHTLVDPDADLEQGTLKRAPTMTPLPIAQLVSLCVSRLSDPIIFTHIFPYVNEMMMDMKVTDDPSRIGFYSGLVESAFAVAQLVSIYHWARLSDVVGRRPVIIMGILGMALGSFCFGLSKTLAGALLARSVSGLFSGNVAVLHAVLGELTDKTNQAIAFPIYGLTWPLGAIIGPLIGGSFSNPANRFPSLFDSKFWHDYPYFLPGLITAVFALVSCVSSYVFLEETLPSKRRKLERVPSDTASWDDDKQEAPPGMRALLAIPAIRALCLSGSALAFTSTAHDVLFVLLCYSPIESGGLAFSASEIGAALAMAGLISVLLQLFVTPFLLARCELARLYRTTLGLWTYCFAILPLIGAFARFCLAGVEVADGSPLNLSHASPAVRAAVWIAVAALLALSKVACLPYAISMMLVKQYAPGAKALGVSNGLVQFAMSLTRAFSPAFASSVFAFSLDYNVLGGYAWVFAMMAVGIGGAWLSRSLLNEERPDGDEDVAAAIVIAE